MHYLHSIREKNIKYGQFDHNNRYIVQAEKYKVLDNENYKSLQPYNNEFRGIIQCLFLTPVYFIHSNKKYLVLSTDLHIKNSKEETPMKLDKIHVQQREGDNDCDTALGWKWARGRPKTNWRRTAAERSAGWNRFKCFGEREPRPYASSRMEKATGYVHML